MNKTENYRIKKTLSTLFRTLIIQTEIIGGKDFQVRAEQFINFDNKLTENRSSAD